MNPKKAMVLALAVVGMMTAISCTCTLASLVSPTSTATPTPTKTPEPSLTPTPADTPTTAETPTPEVTDTPTQVPTPEVTDAPTSTAVPPADTPHLPTATPAPPTATPTDRNPPPTPTPIWEFVYLENTMVSEPNCGSVYLEGEITGVGGESVDGITVRLRWWDNVEYELSGTAGGHSPGKWGFSPLELVQNRRYQPFIIDIVESQANPVPRSDELQVEMVDCSQAGQFTNIIFVYNR